ncbi:MAG: zinc-binding alcohol dehydrogenase family protein [Ignisphaera sp.]
MKAAVLRNNVEIKAEEYSRRYPELPWVEEPLSIDDVDDPYINFNQALVKVAVCGVCYTDIDIIEGRVRCKLPVILGHQIVGKVVDIGKNVYGYNIGDKVGIAWIGHTCNKCFYCKSGQENLCEEFKATGCNIDGGYAEYVAVYSNYMYHVPRNLDDEYVAPLMCAGAVGYRALKLVQMIDGLRLGLFGFGSSAHIVMQIARKLYPSSEIYVFTRSDHHKDLAKKLGADWVGSPYEDPPKKINRAIDFTPVGETIARALEVLDRGGKLVVNVIRKQSSINLDYLKHVWQEKELKSVANVTRADVKELLEIVKLYPINIHIQIYTLNDVNKALRDLKMAKIKGSPVLRIP